MPNWCCNSIFIEGDVKRFRQTLRKPDECGEVPAFCFHATVPRDPGTSGWYEANLASWGTKWDASEPEIVEETDERVIINCETAWSPPLNWAVNCHRLYPETTITVAYCEQGMNFYGYTKVSSTGVEQHSWKIPKDCLIVVDEAGNPVEKDSDKAWANAPAGQLKEFMTTWKLRGIGG